MPISVTLVKKQILSVLDAEGSDRYRDAEDIIPAVNNTLLWIVALFSKAMADKKVSPNVLSELIVTRVWQLSSLSRFSFVPDSTTGELWIELALYPNAETYPAFQYTPPPQSQQSLYRSDLSFVKAYDSAARITEEQVAINRRNPFFPGNEVLTNPAFKTYGYLPPSDYSGGYNSAGNLPEFEVTPPTPFGCCAMKYIKQPAQIVSINDSLPFPIKILDLIAAKAANFISEKQGDQTNLYMVSERDINQLVVLFS
jgi:hypothetical protein